MSETYAEGSSFVSLESSAVSLGAIRAMASSGKDFVDKSFGVAE